MVVTKKLTVDLARKTILGTVDAVRGDSAIALELTLLSDGEPWVVPANASVIMRYCQGKAGGEYDTLPDGTVAWKASGNVLTVRVAPEVCSASGKTDFQVTIFKGPDQISTFRMVVEVEGEVSGIDKPGAYTNLAQWLRYNGAEGQVMVSLELEDLRTATDGTVYQSAGDAVRSQLSKLQTEKVDKTDFAALQNRVEEVANAPCACEEEEIDLTGLIVNDYYTYTTGAAYYQKGERCTDFVPVRGGYQITLKNLLLRGARALCVYDENKKFLWCLKTGTDETELTLRLPMEVFYLRASIDPEKAPDFRYINLLDYHLQMMDNRLNNRTAALDARITREIRGISYLAGSMDLTDKIVSGHYLADNGKALADDGERCTDYIAVKEGYRVCLENVNVRANRSVCVYDENKKFLWCLKTGTEETTFTLTMPENTAYLRTSIDATVMPIIYYADIVDSALALLEKRINNKSYQTESQVQTLIDNAIGRLSVYNGEVEDV